MNKMKFHLEKKNRQNIPESLCAILTVHISVCVYAGITVTILDDEFGDDEVDDELDDADKYDDDDDDDFD